MSKSPYYECDEYDAVVMCPMIFTRKHDCIHMGSIISLYPDNCKNVFCLSEALLFLVHVYTLHIS